MANISLDSFKTFSNHVNATLSDATPKLWNAIEEVVDILSCCSVQNKSMTEPDQTVCDLTQISVSDNHSGDSSFSSSKYKNCHSTQYNVIENIEFLQPRKTTEKTNDSLCYSLDSLSYSVDLENSDLDSLSYSMNSRSLIKEDMSKSIDSLSFSDNSLSYSTMSVSEDSSSISSSWFDSLSLSIGNSEDSLTLSDHSLTYSENTTFSSEDGSVFSLMY